MYNSSDIDQPGPALFDQLFAVAGPFPDNGWYNRTEYGINMTGMMTPQSSRTQLILRVESNKYDPSVGPSRHSWCETWVRKESYVYCHKRDRHSFEKKSLLYQILTIIYSKLHTKHATK